VIKDIITYSGADKEPPDHPATRAALGAASGLRDHVNDANECRVIVKRLLHQRPQSLGVVCNEGHDRQASQPRDGHCTETAISPSAILLPSKPWFCADTSEAGTQNFDYEIAARLPRQVNFLITVDASRRIARGIDLLSEGFDRCGCR
jgi:hypothetical protein